MEYRIFDGRYYVRLDRGDEIRSSLEELCAAQGIRAAQVSGIGGCGSATVGVFDTQLRRYNEHTVEAMLELVTLDGNITQKNGEPFAHLHACFAYNGEGGEPRVLAGHLLSAEILLTGEIVVAPASGVISRRYDEELGIRVWSFD